MLVTFSDLYPAHDDFKSTTWREDVLHGTRTALNLPASEAFITTPPQPPPKISNRSQTMSNKSLCLPYAGYQRCINVPCVVLARLRNCRGWKSV
ncbi:hypothetical protein LshimejAT787_1701170 [Lyophyllum shimeji]|uniref:Uncharacterized protein n=1 Tax=Lyophyllum shimeji TaxID=47721 RepID=A0A9P3PWW0_LYOSH|nr:hypothetical protein LshimejAT787_1701170 [Lyophyllum shimeji]